MPLWIARLSIQTVFSAPFHIILVDQGTFGMFILLFE
jgi:hypothetical protein